MGITPSWRYGKRSYIATQTISKLVRAQLDTLKQQEDVTMWMDLVRTARHPQHLWSIDYIEPLPELKSVNDAIRESELILYGDKRSLNLLDGYKTDIFQEISFHTIRAHLRAEEGHPELSVEIFEELIEDWFDNLPLIRKSNLLMHACLCFLCCQEWTKSYDCLQKHWGLLKYASPEDRDNLGIWDNEIIIREIYWFFMKHVADFRNFYASKAGITASSDLWKHKKTGLLWALSYDDTWVVGFCSLALYNHARTLMPDLPAYKVKPVTVRNRIMGYTEAEGDLNIVSEQNQYLNVFTKEAGLPPYEIDELKINDALFSYLSFSPDKTRYDNAWLRLIQFIDEQGGSDPLYLGSVADMGSGMSATDMNREGRTLTSDYLCVDVSERICRMLREEGVKVVHDLMQNFMSKTEDHFDLCIASLSLHYLLPCNIDTLLTDIANKCSVFATAIHIEDDLVQEMMIEDGIAPFDIKKDGFVSIDMKGCIIEWNKKAEDIFGWSSEEIIGKKLSAIIPKGYRAPHMKAMAKLRESKGQPDTNEGIELTGLHRNGHEFPIELQLLGGSYSENSKAFSCAFVRDISNQGKDMVPMNLQRAELDSSAWLDMIREKFSTVRHKVVGDELYVYATK